MLTIIIGYSYFQTLISLASIHYLYIVIHSNMTRFCWQSTTHSLTQQQQQQRLFHSLGSFYTLTTAN